MYEYKAQITNVVDGDTCDASIDLGFKLTANVRLRIKGYDAPETFRASNEEEYQAGLAAKVRAQELLRGRTVTVRTYKLGIYGRYEADIILPDGRSFADVMTADGYLK